MRDEAGFGRTFHTRKKVDYAIFFYKLSKI
jgi:hypothetical protein